MADYKENQGSSDHDAGGGYVQEVPENPAPDNVLNACDDKQKKLLEAVLAGSPDNHYLIDISGKIIYTSLRTKSLFGHHPWELMGKNIFDLQLPENLKQAAEYKFFNVAESRSAIKHIEKVDTIDGLKTLEFSLTPVIEDDKVEYLNLTVRDMTELKETEEYLKQTNRQLKEFENIINMSPAVVILCRNEEGLPFEHVSDNISQFGYESKDFVSGKLKLFDLVHRDDLERLVNEFSIYGSKKSREEIFHFRIITKQGVERFVENRVIARTDDHGRVTHYQSVLLDITERKTAQEALEKRDELLVEILRSLNEHIAVLDKQGNIILVNEAWEKYAVENGGFFQAKRTGIGENYLESCLQAEGRMQNYANRAFDGIRAVLTRMIPSFTMEYPVFSNRFNKWFLMTVTPLDTENGGAVLSHLDITERKMTELTIRKSEERLNLLSKAIEQSADIMMITDPDGTINYVNSAFLRLTGFSGEEVIGKKPSINKSGQHDPSFYSNLWETIRGRRIWTGHFVNRKKDGELFEEDAVIFPVLDQNGNIMHFAKVSRDVTEKMRLERQLAMAVKMEAVGRLAGGIAHDFNNLLAAITGFTELAMLETDPDHPLMGYFEEIGKAAKRASDLTRQLLAFSRKQITSPKIINFNEVIKDLYKMISRLIQENIELQINLDPDILPVKIDPGQLEQIIVNLAVNSRDAMPDGGNLIIKTGMVKLDETFCKDYPFVRPGNYVMLSVCDSGIGMEEQMLPHIFEPFFTTKERGTGTGLGLATVYGIVKQSEGYIFVDSSPCKGTLFNIYFPPAITKQGFKAEESSLDRNLPMGTEKVLVVEDDEIVRNTLRHIMNKAGYKAWFADKGKEALRISEELGDDIEMVLTDIVLPDINGLDLAVQFRERYPGIRVLLMSGYTDRSIIEHLEKHEEFDFIHKPFKVQDLLQRIRDLFNKPKNI
ncbi:MAG: PAS domain S-box protein [Firmicutes bacterium]|nr:PAS domain S-box protein [Bacillota bacterium]